MTGYMPELILISVTGLYLLLMLIAIFGLLKKQKVRAQYSVFVSVIVPARNEAGNIGNCIESLLKQNYPPHLYELIIVNDGSEDQTAETVRIYQQKDKRVILLDCLADSLLPPGKSRALETGLRAAKGEVIFNTDADCDVSEDWLSETLAFYSDEISMVNGVTLPEGDGWFNGVQTLDFAFLHGVAAGFSGAGLPLAGMGNNMSYRKDIYQKTGGFEKLGFSITEDFQLTRAILNIGGRVRHIASHKTLVVTKPVDTIGGLYSQKKRWAAGGIKSPPFFYLLFFAAWLANVATLIFPFIGAGGWLLLPVVRFLADFLVIWMVMKKVKIWGKLRYFLLFELYLSAYVLIFPLIIPFSKVVRWKGRIFR